MLLNLINLPQKVLLMKKFDKVDLKIIESVKKGNNCAQTVYYYFQDEHGHTDDKINNFEIYGAGIICISKIITRTKEISKN